MNQAADTLITHAPLEYKRAWLARLEWYRTRHKFQIPPESDWFGWMIRAGRGAGKTRTGAEDVADYCFDNPGYLYAMVAPTFGDGRDIMVEGESGVLSVLRRRGIDHEWNRSNGELKFGNGSYAHLFSAIHPDRLRGPSFHRAWCDEPASWKDAWLGDALNTTWNNLMMALRLGDNPQVIITGTPRVVALIRELMDDPLIVETRGSTYDNRENLAGPMLDRILKYEGTRIGKQEIHGELLDDVEGAHWNLTMIDAGRLLEVPPMSRIVVAVDPPGGVTECGITAQGIIRSPCPCGEEKDQPHYAMLADDTIRDTPERWGRQVAATYDEWEADRVVAEANFGGDMVENTLRQVRPELPVKMVRASRGKLRRAEPIAAMYEQGRVHHIGVFQQLEEEMTTYTDREPWSPNRMDALVWGLTDLTDRKEKPDLSGWVVDSDLMKPRGI